jgi:hypothetical protein
MVWGISREPLAHKQLLGSNSVFCIISATRQCNKRYSGRRVMSTTIRMSRWWERKSCSAAAAAAQAEAGGQGRLYKEEEVDGHVHEECGRAAAAGEVVPEGELHIG